MQADVARNIILVGLMGSGKSSVAQSISRKTGCLRLDTDHEIEIEQGRTIAEIFETEGENYFRDAETTLLTSLQNKSGYVISTGGGMVIRQENREILKNLGLVVWLQASEDDLFNRVSRNKKRPLLQTKDPRATLHNLMTQRRSLYHEVAHLQINTSVNTRFKVISKILTAGRWDTPKL